MLKVKKLMEKSPKDINVSINMSEFNMILYDTKNSDKKSIEIIDLFSLFMFEIKKLQVDVDLMLDGSKNIKL